MECQMISRHKESGDASKCRLDVKLTKLENIQLTGHLF